MKKTLKKVFVSALLLVLNIILVRFVAINRWNMKLNLGFIAIAVAAYLFGPVSAIAVSTLGDLIGATLFPVGTYCPAFTVTALITGALYGMAFDERIEEYGIWVIGTIAIINEFGIELLINTGLISALYEVSFFSILPIRLLQAFLQGTITMLCLSLLVFPLQKLKTLTRL